MVVKPIDNENLPEDERKLIKDQSSRLLASMRKGYLLSPQELVV